MGYTITVKGKKGEPVASLENISYTKAVATMIRLAVEFEEQIKNDILSVELKKTNKENK